MQRRIEEFVLMLRHSPQNGAVFNPWWECDLENDAASNAPRIRRGQLKAYLSARSGQATTALIGEALGYRGGHFTGIAMTSERILLGQKIVCADPADVLPEATPQRTSKPSLRRYGFAEPTATIVWGTMRKLQIPPLRFVLWNAFPWHPFDPKKGRLSNRCPSAAELHAATEILARFLEIFPCQTVIALGKTAAMQLARAGVQALQVRHPASGGAREFREQIARVLAKA